MNLSRYTAVLWRGPGRAQVGGDRSHHVLLDNLHACDQLWLANHTNVGQRPASTTPSPELLPALSGSGLLDHTDDAGLRVLVPFEIPDDDVLEETW